VIRENILKILNEIPPHVRVVAAAKTRTPQEITEAIEAGITLIGENYVQETEGVRAHVKAEASWHMIGHLQTNKAKKAAQLFDMIQTVDSLRLAEALDRACKVLGKVMPILIEINSGREAQKAGVLPEEAHNLIEGISCLSNLKVMGLMTMGPLSGDPEESRPYFRTTRALFEEIRHARIPNAEMTHLSMGMSDSYRAAIEEGANMIRLGTCIFGPRG
jgi:pyridoxal phosphate enzyme (YggS family)